MTEDSERGSGPNRSDERPEANGLAGYDTFFAKPTPLGATLCVSFDPSAATGPPWPRLVAGPGYVAPRFIRWPTVVGALLLVLEIGLNIANVASIGRSQGAVAISRWASQHGAAMAQLNQDFVAINNDLPTKGGTRSQFLSDWQALHSDVVADSALRAPPGAAGAPRSIMLSDFETGSSDVLQAAATNNQALALQAQQLINAGAAEAKQLDAALALR